MKSKTPSARHSLIIAAALVGIALLIMPWDVTISKSLSLENVPGDVKRIVALSEFFAHGFGVFVILLAIWTLTPQYRRTIPRLTACALLPGLFVLIMKASIGRYRPVAINQDAEQAGSTWIGLFPSFSNDPSVEFGYMIQSFPSGHTSTAFGMAIGLIWLFPQGKWLFLWLATMAASQRVIFQAHWTSDVFVGCALAVLVSCWITRQGSRADLFFQKFESRESPSTDSLIRMAA